MSRRLKFELLCRGVAPTAAALRELPSHPRGSVIVRDFPTTSGLILRLPHDIYVNARVRFDSSLAYPLDHDGSGFAVLADDGPVAVHVYPPAQYALDNRRLSTGKSIITVANTHVDRIRLNPVFGCASTCTFCTYPALAYRLSSMKEITEALSIALADRTWGNPHVLVSGGTPRAEDYEHVNEVYEVLPRLFPTLRFDAMLEPRTLHPGPRTARKYANFAARLREWRLDAVSVNLEFNSDLASRQHTPEKYAIGRDAYLYFLEQAVERFGRGKVRSVLIVGLESEEETLLGVEALAERGVLVELGPFWADPGAFLARQPEPDADTLEGTYDKAMEITVRHGIPMEPFCVPCSHNIL